MSKIAINNMSYSYKQYYQPIFNNINISIDTDWKLGLIGRNGRGKTTLLRLINGDYESDIGHIFKNVNTEYFPYNVETDYNKTIDVIKESIGKLKTKEDIVEQIVTSNNEKRYDEYQRILNEYMEADGFNIEAKIKKELNLMNLSENLLDQDFSTLSGGEKAKMLIIALFLRKNAFILLDEPGNHLDRAGRESILNYLSHKNGFIVVSHDVDLLDNVVDHIISINKSNIYIEKGNYSTWLDNKRMTEQFEFRTKERLEREIKSLEKDSIAKRSWGQTASEKDRSEGLKRIGRGFGRNAARFMKQAKIAERNMKRSIEEKKNLLKNYETVSDLDINQNEIDDDALVTVIKLSFGYTDRLLFDQLTLQIRKGDIIWLRGNNGTGKSTLLKFISGEIASDFVTFQENIHISQSYQEPLWQTGLIGDLIKNFKFKDKFLDVCKILDIKSLALDKPIETYSSGEKRKIDIARALATENDLLLLDEPLNYMDSYFKEQLEKAILKYKPTLVFVEHDESFGNNIANRIIELCE